MKKIIPFLLLACMACDDDEPDTNLSGFWIFVEPPETPSRKNRNDDSIPAFDVVFEITGKEITYVDLLLDNVAVEETAIINHHGETADIIIEGGGFSLTMTGCKRPNMPNPSAFLAGTVTYTLPSGATATYKGLSISPYTE